MTKRISQWNVNHDPFEEEQQRIRALMQETRTFFFSSAILCSLIQTLLLGLIFREMITSNYEDLITLEYNPFILFMRMFCALLMHLQLLDNVELATQRMKFALNHHYLFNSQYTAFYIAFN